MCSDGKVCVLRGSVCVLRGRCVFWGGSACSEGEVRVLRETCVL